MPRSCTTKQIKKLCDRYTKDTGLVLVDYHNPNFTSWLQKNNPLEIDESNSIYTVIQTKVFASSIMDAYLAAINHISKKLDAIQKERKYTKNEVMDIVFEGFEVAKAEGESNIRILKQKEI